MADQLKVLLIDDEEIVCKRLKPVIEKMGCQIEAYQDPTHAVNRMKEEEFDIVVTDVRMDEIDGIQILELAKQQSDRTLVIVITGYAMTSLAREAMDKGAFDFISKPFKPNDIRRVILNAASELGLPLEFEVPDTESGTR